MFGLKNQIKSVPINSTSPDISGDVLFYLKVVFEIFLLLFSLAIDVTKQSIFAGAGFSGIYFKLFFFEKYETK